ncbi:MAG: hypothetical protein L3J51_13445 [Cocleimonas sp.]|nr:hypothetical protein [Cocleimonas sp.]
MTTEKTSPTDSSAQTQKGKIPLWILVVFFSTVIIAMSSFAVTQYQQQQIQNLNKKQQTELRSLEQSILEQDDVINTAWLHTLNPLVKDTKGSVLWSSQKQQGIIKLFDLPTLRDTQVLHLWIYDLDGKSNAPISGATFKPTSTQVLLAFDADSKVSAPLKFELTLETKGVDGAVPLLLAQP